MTVVKRSVSLNEDVSEQIEKLAAESGITFSTALNEMLQDKLELLRGRLAMELWDELDGPLSEEEIESGRRIVRDAMAGIDHFRSDDEKDAT